MASLQRRISRAMVFKTMNAKQKKLRRAERKKARENPQAEAKRRAAIAEHILEQGV